VSSAWTSRSLVSAEESTSVGMGSSYHRAEKTLKGTRPLALAP